MQGAHSSFNLERGEDCLVCAIRGETNFRVVSALRDELDNWLAAGGQRAVIVDLSDVTFMSTTGISFLVSSKRKVEELGSILLLRRPSKQVVKVLRLVQLYTFFQIEDE